MKCGVVSITSIFVVSHNAPPQQRRGMLHEDKNGCEGDRPGVEGGAFLKEGKLLILILIIFF